MIVTGIVLVAALFVVLLAWGDSERAPAPVKALSQAATAAQERLLTRLGTFFYQRRQRNTIPQTMVSRHYLGGSLNSTRGKHPGIKILAPVTDPEEARMFFLWEVGFHTELDLRVTPPNKIHVSKHERKILEQYCTMYAARPGSADTVFKANGLVLETSKY